MRELFSYAAARKMRQDGKGEKFDAVAVIAGSDSDFPKMKDLFDSLNDSNTAYLLSALSAHRAPGELEKLLKELPGLYNTDSNISLKLILATAGISAHLAGVVASQTQTPVIALAGASSTCGKIDSTFSMINMPPGVPNGFVANQAIAGEMIEKIMNLKMEDLGTVYVSPEVTEKLDNSLVEKLGLNITSDPREATIGIQTYNTDRAGDFKGETEISIVIPVGAEAVGGTKVGAFVDSLENVEGFLMGYNLESKINAKNALIFAAQVIGMFNSETKSKLVELRKESTDEVVGKNQKLLDLQLDTALEPIQKAMDNNLWPASKGISGKRGIDALEDLGYRLFYNGKNADLYLIPNTDPQQVIVYRTDRSSVLDIPLDLKFEGKGAVQNVQGLASVEFAKGKGIRVASRDIPSDIPEDVAIRCQVTELCKPLSIQFEGREVGLELIFRKYLTGSLYKDQYLSGKDPYKLDLPEGLKEWDKFEEPLFTPTTKEKNDIPIETKIVQDAYPEIVTSLSNLFKDFTDYAYERGYVLVDTKFEVFLDSKGDWCLSDEILTPESSRFIKVEDFEAGKYISADKEYIRGLGRKFGWREKWAEYKEKNPKAKYLPVGEYVTQEDKDIVLAGYTSIRDAFA